MLESILTLRQIAQACAGVCMNCDEDKKINDIVTDSRKITPESLFIALRGKNFDGHNFVSQVVASGAVCCVVDKDFDNAENFPVIVVEDTLTAMQGIAAYYRRQFSIPSVAITGSVGKTSTKDMVACVLARKYKTLKTDGNFNNEIGLPLTAFRMSLDDQIAVFEMGMSSFGEISRLTKIAGPETAVITNIGFSHIEHLQSQENILKAKLEILDGLSSEGTVILNGDDPFLKGIEGSLAFETLYYGIENDSCDISAFNIKKYSDSSEFEFKIEGEIYKAAIHVPGEHHIYNALAAILIGIKYNIPLDEIIAGIADFETGGMRQNVKRLSKYVLIEDCYNASPTSMKSGMEVLSVTVPLSSSEPYRRVAVLGDMLELGEYSAQAHRSVGEMACDYDFDCLVAVGNNAADIANGAIEKGFKTSEIYVFYNTETAGEHIKEIIKPNDIILLKGSRGMRLEEIGKIIEEADTASIKE